MFKSKNVPKNRATSTIIKISGERSLDSKRIWRKTGRLD
jgi:hypothetical protein